MAEPSLAQTLYDNARNTVNRAADGIVNAYRTAREYDPTGAIKQIENQVIEPTDYVFKSDAFPEDLGSDYYGHYMTITAFVNGTTPTGAFSTTVNAYGQTGIIRPPSQIVYSAAIFMPSTTGGGAGPI